MIRPRKMKHIEMTLLARDADTAIEYLGRQGLMEFSGDTKEPDSDGKNSAAVHIQETLDSLHSAALYLGIVLPAEPEEDSMLPGKEESRLANILAAAILAVSSKENDLLGEQKKLEETTREAQAFSRLNAPFSELDQLSYLTLRVGRMDARQKEELEETLAGRAVIVPLDDTGRILAAASRKGRFALDSELKRAHFIPIEIPKDYKGIPADLLTSLDNETARINRDLEDIAQKKTALKNENSPALCKLYASFLMALKIEELKLQLRGTQNIYILNGWIPADEVTGLVKEMYRRTEGRAAIRSYNPEEIENITESREKIPVALKHGAFVKGFERLVLSYGAPLYGTLDPTPFVAFFFTLLFGIMFGDVGQGAVLFLLGIVFGSKSKNRFIESFKHFSIPLKAVGCSSMVMGFLGGSFFTNEHIFIKPTQAVLGFFMNILGMAGEPPERILNLMPEKGNIEKLLYFFAVIIGLGIVLNSIGLLINIINLFLQKKYQKALFDKAGIVGLSLFWYALFIVVKIIRGGRFENYDFAGLIIPVILIFFGPAIWRFITGQRPVFEHGVLVFTIEGFVELLESASTYISSTVSFLRVGAFAISHAVLSFIVFTLSDMVKHQAAGLLFSLVILIIGNAVIILLEGMIVAIQTVRLHYYEFFGKFFNETGKVFTPFRFRKTS